MTRDGGWAMNKTDYPACIRELYESEIFGESVFLALIEVARNDRDRYHFGTLLQLETETKSRLRPFIFKYDISLSEVMNMPDIKMIVAGYRQASWGEFVAANIPVVQSFLSRFIEIADAGPAGDQAILDSMVRHEAAILKWLEIEKGGGSESSLDDIIEQLQYPLPTPSPV